MRLVFTALSILIYYNIGCCQAEPILSIKPQATSTKTDAKPQSKVWKYKDTFYTVFPDNEGTHLWQLHRQQWRKQLSLAPLVNTKADCLTKADSVFLLLFDGKNSVFTSLRFDEKKQKYQFLNRADPVNQIPFDASVETATIAMDSKNILWMTYETNNTIVVRQSNPPYKVWGNPEKIQSGVADDDISAIIKMSKAIGVLWSDQNTRQFGFKIHTDGTPISDWSINEIPASQSALNIGDGIADDHINIKYSAAGHLFAAVKTSYDTPQYTKIGLLVRRANGRWDDLYHVSNTGTRPIVTLDEVNERIRVYYTSKEAGGEIVFKESSLNNIDFGKDHSVLISGTYNNVSSTKTPYRGTNVIIASDETHIIGKLISNY